MKRSVIVAVLAMAVAMAPGGVAWSQMPAQPQMPGPGAGGPGPGMMGQGMMGPGMRGGMGMPGRGRMAPRENRVALDERPLITLMLRDRQQLGLTEAQVGKLRDLRSGFEKEAIRAGAEIRIVEIDLNLLLDQDTVDLAKVEAAVRKQEALHATLRLSRIRAIEEAKALLSAEQRQRLRTIVEMQPGVGPGAAGPGMMGGYGGPGGMMGPGPGLASGKRSFASNGEQIYYTGVSRKNGPIPRVGGPMWVQHGGVGCVACHGVQGRGGVPVMMGTAIPEDIRYTTLTAAEPRKEGDKKEEMDHPPFTDATIKRAVTRGIDPANKPVDWTMPRWQMADEDWTDLLAYLKMLR